LKQGRLYSASLKHALGQNERLTKAILMHARACYALNHNREGLHAVACLLLRHLQQCNSTQRSKHEIDAVSISLCD
jgi:hypothetical protein